VFGGVRLDFLLGSDSHYTLATLYSGLQKWFGSVHKFEHSESSDQAGGTSSPCPALLSGCDSELRNWGPYILRGDTIIA